LEFLSILREKIEKYIFEKILLLNKKYIRQEKILAFLGKFCYNIFEFEKILSPAHIFLKNICGRAFISKIFECKFLLLLL